MKRILYDIKLIGVLLSILYVILFASYLHALLIFGLNPHDVISCLFNGVLMIAAFGLIGTKEWSRKLMIAGNISLAGYLLFYIYSTGAFFVWMPYVCLSVILFLFFGKPDTRARFVQKQGAVWRSILVVDDDISVIKIVRPILARNGFSVLTAATGEEGLRIAIKQQPDLIILDVIMPKLKGREVCRQLKEHPDTQNIPVVFLTAKDSKDDVHAELEAGAIAHLTKPVHAKQLVETVSKILN